VVGDKLGIGEPFAGAVERVTVIGALPATPTAPAAGLTEATSRAAGGAAAVPTEECVVPAPEALDLDGVDP
jgi:hypothetical protein